ncbi:hypothetical protein [Parasitella parasitica]|uniref:Coenzyme Q-binding protein COQ10 START domain-containing protein n=1 Tax=Parasitella parasitica TaxID=35722 RepID=A0A0B7N6X2_9FUNG|nr:hypothetical protein [Parasitella parasitica]
MPASHIVSRSVNLKLSPERLWKILIDVSKYPEWQPKVQKVTIQEKKETQTVFIEHSTRKRHTVIVHHERAPCRCLVRVLEERPSIDGQKKIPTFSGSWTFEITQETSDQVTLKITEQGVIKKPIVRATHMLLFGYHRRVDRFIHDLQALLAQQDDDFKEPEQQQQDSIEASSSNVISHNNNALVAEGGKKVVIEEEYQKSCDPSPKELSSSEEVKRSMIKEEEGLTDNTIVHATTAADSSSDQCSVETSDTIMTESKLVSGWDIVSAIVDEHPPKTSA